MYKCIYVSECTIYFHTTFLILFIHFLYISTCTHHSNMVASVREGNHTNVGASVRERNHTNMGVSEHESNHTNMCDPSRRRVDLNPRRDCTLRHVQAFLDHEGPSKNFHDPEQSASGPSISGKNCHNISGCFSSSLLFRLISFQ